jgi:hypothetical protein
LDAGNEAIKNKDYTEAEAFYTEAISVAPQGPNTHIYYCNRAAARSFLEDFAAGKRDALEGRVLYVCTSAEARSIRTFKPKGLGVISVSDEV